MAKKQSNSSNSKTAQMTSQSIQQQTEKYLESGGQINVIKNGVTGLNNLKASKHIKLGNSENQN